MGISKSRDLLCDRQGNYITDERYKEIKRLHVMLQAARIPHTFAKIFDGYQICYPCGGKERVADAVEHFGSYGSENDLLEIMGLLTPEDAKGNSVLGHLTAEDVFERMRKHYQEEDRK